MDEVLKALESFFGSEPEASAQAPGEGAAAPAGVGGGTEEPSQDRGVSAEGTRLVPEEDVRRLQSLYDRREAQLRKELKEADNRIKQLEDRLLEVSMKDAPEEHKKLAKYLQEVVREREELKRQLEAHRILASQYQQAANEAARPIVVAQLAKKHGIEDRELVDHLVDWTRRLGISTVEAAEALIEGYARTLRRGELARRAEAGTDRVERASQVGPKRPAQPPKTLDEAVSLFIESIP
jgi:hypothetical protein